MLVLIQPSGVFKAAFVTVAVVDDVRRFAKASEMATYGGHVTTPKHERRGGRSGQRRIVGRVSR